MQINASVFIRTDPIKIKDPKHAITKSDTFYIKFASLIPSNINQDASTLFGQVEIDNEFLRKRTESKLKIGSSEHILYSFPNIALPLTTDIITFKYMIAYLFELNISQVNALYEFTNEAIWLDDNVIETEKEAISKIHYLHAISIEVANRTISIGSHPLVVNIIPNTDNKNNTYEELFYTNYFNTMSFIKTSLEGYSKRKITKIDPNLHITELRVMLNYYGPESTIGDIDIMRLFNMHSIEKTFGKIYIHANDIDSYLGTPRSMQYVKISANSNNPFKGVEALYDTCSFYIGEVIESGYNLHRIDVCKNTTITFVFTNTNLNYSYSYLKEITTKWFTSNSTNWLKKIKLNDCIYNTGFNYKYFIPTLDSVSANCNINHLTSDDIEQLGAIMNQDVPQLKFITKTSINFSSYLFKQLTTMYRIKYQGIVHEFLTSNILFNDMFTSVHVGLSGNNDNGTITISNTSSFDEMMFTFALIYGTFKKATLNETVQLENSELSIDIIRKNATKYKKGLLKLLTKIDPVLFGPRKVNNRDIKPRSFSGLCQKQQQRVVPISKTEFEYLKGLVPNSVVDVRNQTYPEQRLYLFCPYKQFDFLNYHRFPDQTCIIRCTTKPSNRTQYNYCAESLGAKNMAVFNNKYENQTITLYNPLITKGRKCQVPPEMKGILIQYILLKLNTINISQYCLSMYDKYPFIIRRDVLTSSYEILSEYDEEMDYVLILQSEVNEDYFIFLNKANGKPLVFSENEEIKHFFMYNVKKTDVHYKFFNYVEKIVKDNISQYYNKTSKDILTMLNVNYGIKYVINNKYINGVIYENKLYLTPKLYWQFDEIIYVVPLFKVIEDVLKNNIGLPDITKLDFDLISKIYIDYEDMKGKMINYNGNEMLVQAFDITAKYNVKDIIIFDFNSVLFSIYNVNLSKNNKFIDSQIKRQQIGDILQNYIFIYTMTDESLDEKKLKKYLQDIGIVFDKDTFIDYDDKKTKLFISWRNSKINEKDFDEYMNKFQSLNINDIIKTTYNKFQSNLRFRQRPNEVICTKIISS